MSEYRSHVVVHGDTIRSLADKYEYDWYELWKLNRSIIGENYSVLREGMTLVMPPQCPMLTKDQRAQCTRTINHASPQHRFRHILGK